MGEVSLRLSPEVSSPLLCGVFRPTILMPADIADWTTPDERAAMIRHELAHVNRRDPLINLFQAAFSVIFFFHPLVHYACRQLSLEREMACDDRVVASGVAAEVYAAGILKAAERSVIAVGAPSGAHQLAIFGARQILEQANSRRSAAKSLMPVSGRRSTAISRRKMRRRRSRDCSGPIWPIAPRPMKPS